MYENAVMNLDEALEQPVEAYMAWCREFTARLAARDAMAALVLGVGGEEGRVLQEALWARRYYLHHASKIQPAAPAAEIARADTVTLMCFNPAGGVEQVGEFPLPPVVKMAEIVERYFGASHKEGDEADLCQAALAEFYAWLVQQGQEDGK